MKLALMIGAALLAAGTALHAQAPKRFDCSQAEGKTGADHTACVRHERLREACKDRKGDDYRACIKEQRKK